MTSPLRWVIARFDGFLSWALRVYSFTDDPRCILRLRTTRASRALSLPDGMLAAGEPVLELHLWNSRIPPMDGSGSGLAWVNQIHHEFIASLRLAAREMQTDPRLAGVCAVSATSAFLYVSTNPARVDQWQRLGFSRRRYHSPLGAFGEFWENFYSWGLMWTYNPRSVKNRSLLAARRYEIWISAREFTRRYGSPDLAAV